MVAWRSKERFVQVFAFGLVTPIVVQSLLNIAVVARAVPTTGIPLPFISSGGSSMLVTLVSAALLVNMCRRHIHSENARGQYAR
jgi:cell division protein FtsW